MYLSPVFQENQFTDNVEFLVGGLLWTYKAGTSEFALAYQDQAGTTPWPNPIILNSRGETGGELWLSSDNEYRLVVETAPEYGQTHGVVITEFDNVSGVNAPATEASDNWVQLDKSPNYIDSNEFSVEGDYRGIFVTNRKIQIVDSTATSVQSVISSSLISGFTRVEVSATIDAGISSVKYSNVAPDASPNRFVDIYATGDLSVTDTIVAGGNLVVGGTFNGKDPNEILVGALTSGTPGSLQLDNGLLIQWGSNATDSVTAYVDITLPITYTDPQWSILATAAYSGLSGKNVTVLRTSNSVFRVSSYSGATATGDVSFYWLVFGKKV